VKSKKKGKLVNNKIKTITTEKEGKVLRQLTAPMLLGILGMIIFNLMDTLYVSRLGTIELAAISFTFPVVMVIGSIAHGLGVGITVTVSKASGAGNREEQTRLITWGLILSVLIVVVFVIIGLLTIDPLFRLLGADNQTLPIIKEYMSIWYWGVIFVVIPMTGNSAIRGLGDTKTPALVMLVAAVANTILDPLLIFGLGPFPELGVRGAAIATVISRSFTFVVACYVLIFREKLISFKKQSYAKVKKSLLEILSIGIPNSLTKMIVPISLGVITSIIASHGREAVAGYGISTRIEMFALLPINALVSVLPVFIGQNLGAGKDDRVHRGIKVSRNFVLIYGLASYIVLFFMGQFAGSLFNDEPKVIDVVVKYFRIIPISYGLLGVMQIGIASLNVLKRPVNAALLTLIQMLVLYIPLAMVGSNVFGVSGIFASLVISYLVMGPISYKIASNNLKRMYSEPV
jgi:putative MATE family efflux protein